MVFRIKISDDGYGYLVRSNANKLINEGYGFLEKDFLRLEGFEALYLLFKNLAILEYKEKELSLEEALKFFKQKDEKFFEKFLVYMKLREKNHPVVKGYGDDYVFLLYERGKSVKETAANYIVAILEEGKSIEMDKLDEMLDFALRMRKSMIFAVIDSNSDVSFYEASKIKL